MFLKQNSKKLLSDKIYRKVSSDLPLRQSSDLLQMINNNKGYRLWNMVKWKGDGSNTSVENSD
jgi:hypothetical protein